MKELLIDFDNKSPADLNKNINIINIGTKYWLTFSTPFTLVRNTQKHNMASIKLPNILDIPISCSKYAPNPAIII